MYENKLIVDKDRQKIRHLLIVKDRKGKRIVPLSLTVYSLGRSQNNSIILDSSFVSRHHATILPIANSDNKLAPFIIIDGNLQGIKSTNGILINGVKSDRHNLKHGDFVEFGNKVKVTYYTLFNLSESEFTQFCDLQNSPENTESFFKSQAITINNSQIPQAIDATPTNSASFFQLIPHPLIEIDLSGSITYYNFAAVKQFPELLTLKQNHPAIEDIPKLVQQQVSYHFTRQIKLQNKLFEEFIQYSLDENIIQILIVEITQNKETTIITRYSDRLLQEVVVSNSDFATKIDSLLKIGCECFELDIGFLAKLHDNTLSVEAIGKKIETNNIKEQLLTININSPQQDIRLFSATIETDKPLIWQYQLQEIDKQLNVISSTKFPIKAYLGVSLKVGNKLYGILAFYSLENKPQFTQAQIEFLATLKQCLVKEIERQKIELILKKVLKQKNYYRQIAENIVNPIDEVKTIAKKLINTIDAQENNMAETEPDNKDNWLSLIEKLGDI